MEQQFDAIVVGSGVSGGWSAKELCEAGLKVLLLERGRDVQHQGPEYKDFQAPWEIENRSLMPEGFDENGKYKFYAQVGYAYKTENEQWFVDENEHPYSYPEGQPFMWIRGYHLGGRSITWARQSYRWSPMDFEANAKDGHGIPWPIGYDDIAPWYDHVEEFAGISGSMEEIPALPNSRFLKPWDMNVAEQYVADKVNTAFDDRRIIIGRCAHLTEAKEQHLELGRGPCQARNYCRRGCSFGAYFTSLAATLPAAERTGNLTKVTDAIVSKLIQDPATGKVSHVEVVDRLTKETRRYSGKVVFLNASTIGTNQILLNSRSDANPGGLGNSSGMLGKYIMDHFGSARASGTLPGFLDKYEFGRRPNGIYVPNFRHEQKGDVDFVRGFGYQGGASRTEAGHTGNRAGIGANAKSKVGEFGPWRFNIGMFGELLPYEDNTVTLLDNKVDQWGIPIVHIDATARENERKMIKQAEKDAVEMLEAAGLENIRSDSTPEDEYIQLGDRIHEMGGACMGADPRKSVTNKWNQLHDAPNVFITDGAAMPSCATQNPSLTYMAFSARAANHAVELLKEGQL